MSELNLDELEAIGKAATSPPWRMPEPDPMTYGLCKWNLTVAQAAFCVTARDNWQELIDEIRSIRLMLAAAEKTVFECGVESGNALEQAYRQMLPLKSECDRLRAENEQLKLLQERIATEADYFSAALRNLGLTD